MVRHDIPAGVAAAALSCDCKARGDCYPCVRPACYLPASRLLCMGVAVFGEGEGGEGGGAGYAGVRVARMGSQMMRIIDRDESD